jgi:hypothetical protein
VQPAGGIDEDRIAALRLARRDRIEDNRRGIGAFARAYHLDSGPAGPNLQLFHGRRAKRVGGANQRPPPLILEEVRELAHRGRLARAVDADNQRDLGTRGDDDRAIDGRKHVADFLLDQVAQAGAVARPRLHRGDDAVGGGNTDVRGDQELFERLDRVDVDRARPLLGRICNTDELIEPFDYLLGGAGETFANASQETHCTDLTARIISNAALVRFGRSRSAKPSAVVRRLKTVRDAGALFEPNAQHFAGASSSRPARNRRRTRRLTNERG